jgi:hypothetical protein
MTSRLIAAVFCATVLAACSSSTSGGPAHPNGASSAAPTRSAPATVAASRSSAAPSATPVITPVSAKLWWNQFAIELIKTTYTPDGNGAAGGTLTVTGTIKNLTDQARQLAGQSDQPSLTTSGTAVALQNPQFESIPAKATTDLSLSYRTDTAVNPANSTLTFGSTDELQSSAVLTAGGTVQTVEPKTVSAGAKGTTSVLALAVTGGTADASYRALEKGKYELRVGIDATYSGKATGGYYLAATQFSVAVGGAKIVSTPREPDDLSAMPIAANAATVHTFVSFLLASAPPASLTVTYDGATGNGVAGSVALNVVLG